MPALEAIPGLVHAFSTLDEGSVGLNVPDPAPALMARKRFAESLRLEFDEVTVVGAVHGANVARVDEPSRRVDGVDGLVTDRRGIALFATFGDCYPILLADPKRRCIGLAHAGWRGTASGIARAAVDALQREYGSRPEDLTAVIGPGICGVCYEVGEEVAKQFAPEFSRPSPSGRFLLDLEAAKHAQLAEAGVGRIERLRICTLESDNLPSHRRTPDGSRFGAVMAMR